MGGMVGSDMMATSHRALHAFTDPMIRRFGRGPADRTPLDEGDLVRGKLFDFGTVTAVPPFVENGTH